MPNVDSKRTFRVVVAVLAVVTVCLVGIIGAVLFVKRPLSPQQLAATLTAMPSSTPPATLTPTAVPTVPGHERTIRTQRIVPPAHDAANLLAPRSGRD